MLDDGDTDTLNRHFETAIRTVGSTLAAEAEGTAGELTAHFVPGVKQLT